jgi:hypothetical protein
LKALAEAKAKLQATCEHSCALRIQRSARDVVLSNVFQGIDDKEEEDDGP